MRRAILIDKIVCICIERSANNYNLVITTVDDGLYVVLRKEEIDFCVREFDKIIELIDSGAKTYVGIF